MKEYFKIIVIVLFATTLNCGAQIIFTPPTSYTVTVETVNTSATGELDDIIPLAVADANAGAAVTVYFNVQNGTGNNLVKLTSQLPQIYISSGRITFKNINTVTALTTDQGIQFNGTVTDVNFLNALKITSTGGRVSVDGLRLEDFQTNGVINRTAIYYTSNVGPPSVIENSFFSNNGTGVLNEMGGNITVLHSVFQSNNIGFHATNISAGDAVFVSGCTFQQIAANADSYGIACYSQFSAPYDALSDVYIGLNTFIDNDIAFHYYNGKRKDVLYDYLYFENNTIANTSIKPIGVQLLNPIKSSVVKTNNISNCSIAFNISSSTFTKTNPNAPNACIDCSSGIDFVSQSTNEFLFPYQWFKIKKHNSDNIINQNCPIAYNVVGYYSEGVNIIDQVISSQINIENGGYTNVYNSQIQTSNPLNLNNVPYGTIPTGVIPGNYNIQPPIINSVANIGGGNLGVHFSLAGMEAEQMNYIVSCYRSNAQGHILELLGSVEIDAIATSYYKTFNTGSFSVANGDKVALMVTSLGSQSIVFAYAAGTSQPAYADVLPPCAGNEFVSFSGLGYVETSLGGVVCANNDVVLNVNSGITTGAIPTIYFDFGDGTTSTVQSYTTSIIKNYTNFDQQDIQVLISNTGCGTVAENISFKVKDCCCKLTEVEIKDLPASLYSGSTSTLPNVSILPEHTLSILPVGDRCNLPENFPYTSTNLWTWGDGSPGETWNSSIGLSHSYTAEGNYNLIYNFTSNYPGCAAQTYSTSVNVSPCCKPTFKDYASGFSTCLGGGAQEIDPKVQPIIYVAVCAGSAISFNMSNYTCPSGALTYTWDYGDGTAIETGDVISHIYGTAGTYSLSITYNNGFASSCFAHPGGIALFVITVESNCCPVVTQQINAFDKYSSDGKTIYCVGNNISFEMNGLENCLFDSQLPNAQWSFGDGATANGGNPQHVFNAPGTYTITAIVNLPTCAPYTFTTTLTLEDCDEITCADCISSFAPEPGKYVFSMWVREDVTSSVVSYSQNVGATVKTVCQTCTTPVTQTSFTPNQNSQIIDGWQKVEGTFTVPSGAIGLAISLFNNSTGTDVYFDDLRIHPFNSSSKTYVYDPVTMRLSAELDENNYATFYEYDEEGALVRVKKETEKGIKTIKEARNNIQKK
ncbi:MAG: PKD domain-containing protein [Bacteroidota bacterium]|nr:PKD domain-containing protein [Bacteroidota bacterium]